MIRHALAAALLAGTAAPAAATSSIDSTSSFYTGGSTTLTNLAGFDFKPFDFGKSVSVGHVYGSKFFGHYGTKLEASIEAKLEVDGNVGFQNTIAQVNGGSLRTVAGNPFGGGGSSFVLNASFGNPYALTFAGQGRVFANLEATAFAGANLYGKACVVACISGNIATLGIGNPAAFDVLDYDSASNSVTFLNKTYSGVLPQHFDSDTLPISADLRALDVSGKGTGATATTISTKQDVAGVYVDVAKAIVDAFGLPGEVLSGSALGFDYTTVSAKVGAALQATYNVASNLYSEFADYKFSAPVQIFNSAKGQWGKATTEALLSNGDTAIVRPVSQVASLSILPTVVTANSISTSLSLSATIEDHVKLLEISGYGLDAGPLYTQDGALDLGTLATINKSGTIFASTALSPLTLTFGGASALAAPLSALAVQNGVGIAPVGTGGPGFVFIPDDPSATGDTVAGHVYLATNFGTPGCNADGVSLCTFARNFTPIAEQQRVTRSATGAPEISYAVDFATIDRFTAAPEGAFGTQGSADTLRALLAGLPGPGTGGYGLPADISGNTTPFMPGIPEPASWALMLAGFGLVGGLARQRRYAVVAA